MYIHNTLYADIFQPASRVTENLESLFVQLTNGNTPITIGVIYRPPSGDLDQALIELSEILDDLPKHSYIGGDFNIDLLQHKSKHIIDFEDVTMSRGFLPLISIVTHEKPGCKGFCIDNFITNDIENVLHTGTISDKISHHFPIVQIFQSNLKPIKNTTLNE